MAKPKSFLKQWGGRLLLVLLAVGVVSLIFWGMNQTSGVRRPAQQTTIIAELPPPPPPPPSEPPKPEEPEPEPEKEVPTDEPKPEEPQAAPPPLTIGGPAQAGGDAFGIAAGSGTGGMAIGKPVLGDTGLGDGGMASNSFSRSAYRRLMAAELQQSIQSDDRLGRAVFQAEVNVVLDDGGRVTNATIKNSSGNPQVDQSILQAIQRAGRISERPPLGMLFPQVVKVRGRRSA